MAIITIDPQGVEVQPVLDWTKIVVTELTTLGALGVTMLRLGDSLLGGEMREAIRFDDPAQQPRSEMDDHDGDLYFTLSEFESDIWVVDVEWR